MSRTKIQKSVAKKLLSKPSGELLPIDLLVAKNIPLNMTRAFSNNRYVVQIYDNEKMCIAGVLIDVIRVFIQRHDDKPIPNHWSELQKIKNTIFGGDSTAIEFYPSCDTLIDCANIYWLWIINNKLITPVLR